MNRDFSFDATILALHSTGSANFLATVLSAERGVFNALLFGGPKSRLRSAVSPWHSGKIWIYAAGKTESELPKITDFDAERCHEHIREDLFKTFAANLASELAIVTNAAGDYAQCALLLNAFFDGIDSCSDEEAMPALLRFLWRFLHLLGVQASVETCAFCGDTLSGALYVQEENAFACSSCGAPFAHSTPTAVPPALPVSESAMQFLRDITTLKASASRKIIPDALTQNELKNFLFFLIKNAAHVNLKTLLSQNMFYFT